MKWRTTTLLAAMLAATMAGAGWAAAGKVETLKIGAKAPDFNLPDVDGKRHALASFRKSDVLVVIFTCNHCPTAQAYEDRIKKIAADYEKRGVAVAAISPNDPRAVRLDELGYTDLSDSLEEMKIRARDHKFNFSYLYDGDKQEVSRAYGPIATPHVFIFDRRRVLRYVGRVDDAEKPDRVKSQDARNAIEALLAGKDVPIVQTKAFGCSIKWSDKRDSARQALERWAKEPVKLQQIDAAAIGKLAANDSAKLRLINVWSIRPGPSAAELAELVTIHRMYRGREFEMVTICTDRLEQEKLALEFLSQRQVSCTNYLYAGPDANVLTDAVDTQWQGGLPYTLVVKPGGEIIYRHAGMIDPLEVKRAIVGYLGRTYK